MELNFNERVAIVTGAGNGLGRSHAVSLAARGARVVVNDLGGDRSGSGGSSGAADAVVEEIRSAGGTAMASSASVTDKNAVRDMVAEAISAWGRIDILVNNAGILRDKSFGKMDLNDWDDVINVHLNGSAYCSQAVWPHMREAGYGRIVLTTSTSGLYGNFGQANYGAAKTGMLGLMNVLQIEGMKHNIHVNCIAPTAATRMTEDVIEPKMLEQLNPVHVTPGVVFLSSDKAPMKSILLAGAGSYATARIVESKGFYLAPDQRTAETLALRFDELADLSDFDIMETGIDHVKKIVDNVP